jgi:hypothetical protein
MTRLLTLVVLGIAVAAVPILGEARSKRIHVTAKVVESTFTGVDTAPKIGDQRITTVNLFDDNDKKVGTGVGVCTLVTTPDVTDPTPDALQQCLLTAAFDEGHIIFGGITPLPAPGAESLLGILGGTEKFRKARGQALLVITPEGDIDSTFDLEIDSARRHGEFAAQ